MVDHMAGADRRRFGRVQDAAFRREIAEQHRKTAEPGTADKA